MYDRSIAESPAVQTSREHSSGSGGFSPLPSPYDMLPGLPRGFVPIRTPQDIMETSFAVLPEADTDEHWLVGKHTYSPFNSLFVFVF